MAIFQKQVLTAAISSAALLAGCSGGSSSSSPVGTGPAGTNTTTFAVSVDDGSNRTATASVKTSTWQELLAGFFISEAHAEPVENLDPSQFSVTIIGGAPDGSDLTLDASEFTVEIQADGTYAVTVPGDPRFDCFIAADLDGDGQLDLRAPTVDEGITIDPVSEYVTSLLEANAENFTNFSLSEVAAIVEQVRQQVDDDPELQQAISDSLQDGDQSDVNELLNGRTTVSEQFDVAALPEPENAGNIAGDYKLLQQFIFFEKETQSFDNGDDPVESAEIDLGSSRVPASLALDGDTVEFNVNGEATETRGAVGFGFDGLFLESDSFPQNEILSGTLTSVGFNVTVGGGGPQTEDDETSTEAKTTINFLNMTNSFEAFISTAQFRIDGTQTTGTGSEDFRIREFPWLILAKEQTGFAPAALAKEDGGSEAWGLVVRQTEFTGDRFVENRSEALSMGIDSAGQFLFNGGERFMRGYETNLGDSDTAFTDSSFGPGESDTIPMTYASDGSFSFDDSGPELTFDSSGVVFSGNEMLALTITEFDDGEPTNSQDDIVSSEMIFGVRKSETPAADLGGKTFLLAGRLYFNNASSVEVIKLGPVTLTFSADASTVDLKGVSSGLDINSPFDGTAGQVSGAFEIADLDVSISPESMVRIEDNNDTDAIKLNGFVSSDAQNLILSFSSKESDSIEGDTGMFIGRCSANCN